ncbi:hypothetical protein LOD99_13065 [Oopsacas minuta]|uniref:Uncharacterized protein n=1 Tax=Oopsacas minuta TaxID=111878 RepID=A0AAV7JAU0_9METZ|nr:hypothetical protein LOD99_13065 [Oopsacas minuta]
MSAPSLDIVFPSPIDQLSSLLSLSQQIRTATDTGEPLSKLDLLSKLDTILPFESFSPSPIPSPYNYSTPNKYHNDLMASVDSGVALTGSFSSLYESDESVISPHASSGRRANRSLNLRPSSAKNHRNKRSSSPQQQDAHMFNFLQTVSTEFSTSLRALLEKIDRDVEKKSNDLTGNSGSDVTLPEIESVQNNNDINQLIEKNSILLNTCNQLKARVKEERREGKNLRRENTSLMLEREGLLSKMSETEKEIIEKLSEHGALMESYSNLEEMLKDRERTQRETQARITAMGIEVNKLTKLLIRVQQDLSKSVQREDEYQCENIHLQEELVLKENEVNELKSAVERVQSHARILSALDNNISSSQNAHKTGLSTDAILRDTASLCQQLDSLAGLFGTGTSYDLYQIRAGLSHALADGNILLQNILALKNEHEHCKDALFELQQNANEYKNIKSDENLDLLAKIAEMAPRLKMEAERLAEQWEEPITQQDYLILSQLRELLTDYTGRDVTNESLFSTLSALLACRDRDMNQSVCSMNSESAELEGRMQESSLLLNNMSVALNDEQMKRRSQVRALKKKILRDTTLLKNIQLERDIATSKVQLIKRELSHLCENIQSGNITDSSFGITEPCIKELAKLIDDIGNKKITALEDSLKAAYNREEKTVKLLEFKLSENEKYYEQVRQLTLDRVKIEGVNAELQTAVARIEEQLISEREDGDTRENLLNTKLRIVQQHIQKYDDFMFAELDQLSVQVKDDTKERDLQQRREDSSMDMFKKLKEELCLKQDEAQFLEKEVTVYKLKLHNLENLHREEIEKIKLSNEPEKPAENQKEYSSQYLPDPSPLTIPPMTSLKGQELRTALGVALTQEQLYAKAHLSLQTERDSLARENKQLRDRINALHQCMTDPRRLLATHSLPLVSQEHEVSFEEIRLQQENEKLSNHVTELSTRVSKLSHYKNLYFDSKLKYSSLLWQKSYLKSQLNVYFSSLLASGLILGDLGVGCDRLKLNRALRGYSKFRCYVWVVIFTHRLSHSKCEQQSILYLNYTPSLPLQSRLYQ